MPLTISIAPRENRLAPDEVAALAEAVAETGRATLVVPRFAVRDRCRRDLADAGLGVAVEVTTADAWIAGLWELWGDGRQLVDTPARRLLIAEVLAEGEAAGAAEGAAAGGARLLRETAGTVDMLARAARAYLPRAIDGAAEDAAVTVAERLVLKALARYAALLDERGLMEPAQAADALATAFARDGLPPQARALFVRELDEVPCYLLDLLAAVARTGSATFSVDTGAAALGAAVADAARTRGVTVEVEDAGPAPTPAIAAPGAPGSPAIFEVAGPTARDAAYTELIAAAAAGTGAVAVAAPRPVDTFRRLAPRLAARGLAVRAEGTLPFARTRAGETFAVLMDFLGRVETEEPSAWWPAPELPDWIRSPFSGLGPGASRTARALDTRLRKTRKFDAASLMAELDRLQSREQQRMHEYAERTGADPRPVVMKPVLDALAGAQYARALKLMRDAAAAASPAAFGAEGTAAQLTELAALDAALELFERARALGLAGERAHTVLEGLRVRTALSSAPAREGAADDEAARAGAEVRIFDVDALADERSGQVDAVLLTDVDAASYPLAHRTTVDELLGEKLGAAPLAVAPAARQRRQISRALATGRARALAYVAHDAHGEERFAALAVGELRARAAGEQGSGWPAVALPHEGTLAANADPAGWRGARVDDAPRAGVFALAPELVPYVLLSTRAVGGEARPRTLSASQIENYLACPYRWLVSNRAATRRLDLGFGPIEMGNFVHDVMQRFHERLREGGLVRVTPQNLEACRAEMDAAFDEMRADHARGKYTHGKYAKAAGGRPQTIKAPLVATDEIERGQIEAIRPKLHEVVRYESDMLGIFVPELFEYAFDKEGVSYAGYPLGGRIDRIDVAPDAGSGARFVVIDYKNRGALGEFACPDPTMVRDEGEALDEMWLPGRDEDRSPKVQTLIYATAYARLTGGSPQGAVYFGTRGPVVRGAVAAALTESEPAAFPHDKVSGYPGVKQPRSRTAKHDGTLSFEALLEQVEHAISRELSALAAGRIAPAPAADACTYCPLTMCPRRR